MAQHAGRSTSAAKAAAARTNGAKGGRPRKAEPVVAKSAHVIEEVVLHKGVQERVETIMDTIRREEVEITGPTKQPMTVTPTGTGHTSRIRVSR